MQVKSSSQHVQSHLLPLPPSSFFSDENVHLWLFSTSEQWVLKVLLLAARLYKTCNWYSSAGGKKCKWAVVWVAQKETHTEKKTFSLWTTEVNTLPVDLLFLSPLCWVTQALAFPKTYNIKEYDWRSGNCNKLVSAGAWQLVYTRVQSLADKGQHSHMIR